MTERSDADAERLPSASTLAAEALTKVYREQFGRGPENARAAWAGDNCLVVTLEGSLTPAERALVRLGEHQRLRDVRLIFQHALEDEFRETIARITGRHVRAFVSGIDTVEDVSSEIFYFRPVEA